LRDSHVFSLLRFAGERLRWSHPVAVVRPRFLAASKKNGSWYGFNSAFPYGENIMKNALIAFVIGCLIAAGATYAMLNKGENVGGAQKEELLGYTKYSDYLAVGKQTLQEQSKFLAATVQREETYTRKITKKKLFKSDATIVITYTAEYSFGYDLKPDSYEIRDTASGIEIVLSARPALVATPAMKSKKHEIPDHGLLINEQSAIVELYEGMDDVVLQKGNSMASEEAIVALCEKKLSAFFREFLSRQPGVKKVPGITVTYKT
jgi:hypothetical protein